MPPSEKLAIVTDKAPKPIGPYTPAIRQGNLLFCSGMIGIDPKTNKLVSGGVAAEARRAFENLSALLEAGGSSPGQVLKTTMFLKDIADFVTVNEIYAEYFGENPPARSTIQVGALPAGALVEVDAIASVE